MRSLGATGGGPGGLWVAASVVVSVADKAANYGKSSRPTADARLAWPSIVSWGTLGRLMPTRRTKRGADRTRLDADADVLVCGASFAGLAAARELAGTAARGLIVDRYEVGERQTSACAAPTD